MSERLLEVSARLEERVAGVEGRFGVAAWPVGKPDEAFGINLDESFPTASVFKVPLLYALYQMHDRGEVDLAQRIRVETEHLVPGSGVLQGLDTGLEPTIRDLAVLMIVLSDNQATDMLYAIVGPDRIHAAMDELGLHRTRVPMSTKALLYDYVGLDPDNPEHTYDMSLERMRKGEYNRDGAAWSDVDGSGNDLTTPREMARLCEAIEQGVGLSAEAREGMLDIMKRQKFNERIPAGLPENTDVAHKTGSLKGVRNDAGIVYAPSGPYTVAIFSKRLSDEKAGVQAIGDLSKIVWETLGDEG
ncbi:MAG TPA: class A beta-lactamase-related serine hydrolase [Thermomicrobiales bacterium]|nr:class A beta-lactamase-related serine hydrolase [Thermomicrobiales bacterium]